MAGVKTSGRQGQRRTMSASIKPAAPSTQRAASPWSPFRYVTFTTLWTATVVSNIGTWMYNAASGWLMTSLDPAPLTVSLVQVANRLPMCLLVFPAGVFADVIDRRRLLIAVQAASTAVAAAFAVLVW